MEQTTQRLVARRYDTIGSHHQQWWPRPGGVLDENEGGGRIARFLWLTATAPMG